MSEHLHPDIDSLNAFVEGVLQEHERLQCLAHIAECPRCRELVFLAQEPPTVRVAPSPALGWRRWFTPIPVLAAAAIVCIALGGTWLYLRSRMEAPPREVVATRVKQPPQSPENRVEPQVSKPSIAREEKHSVRARSYAPPPIAKDARSEIARAAAPREADLALERLDVVYEDHVGGQALRRRPRAQPAEDAETEEQLLDLFREDVAR